MVGFHDSDGFILENRIVLGVCVRLLFIVVITDNDTGPQEHVIDVINRGHILLGLREEGEDVVKGDVAFFARLNQQLLERGCVRTRHGVHQSHGQRCLRLEVLREG